MTARQSDRKTYDEATRLSFGLVSKRNADFADYAINTQATNIAILKSLGGSFLTQENQEWLESFIVNIGRSQFIAQLDSLSQASIFLAQEEPPEKNDRKIPTPLDGLKINH